MIFCKMATAGALAAAAVTIFAVLDSWRNRRKYSVRERNRSAEGGLQ